MKLAIALACLLAVVAAEEFLNIQPRGLPNLISPPFDGRITNGELAHKGQFKYQVGLMMHLAKGSAWCGGSLISDKWVLTAGHCAHGVKSIDVYLGATDRTAKKEEGREIIKITKEHIRVHERYNEATIENDIALLELPEAIKFTDLIQPVSLPKESRQYDSYAGKEAIASGWGRTSDEAKGATDLLRYIETEIMENSKCARYFVGSVKSNNICIRTKTTHKSTCNGDSGGPLVIHDGQKPILVGATSFGSGIGCEAGFPGVFTRVTSYLDWIKEHSGVSA